MSDNTSTTSNTEDAAGLMIDEAELQQLNEEMIKSDLITPDNLYVDLALIKDFNIGTLLTFRDERKAAEGPTAWPALYQSILDGLGAYRDRKFDDLAHHFPAFGLSTTEIKARKHDPNWAGHILMNSPVTPFIRTLQAQIAVNVNHSAVIGKRDPVDLVINIYPLKLNSLNRNLIARYFGDLLRVRVVVAYIDVTTITLASVINFDEMYTYYFKDLFEHDDIRAAYSALKFIRKRLYVPKLFGEQIVSTMDTEQEARIIKSRCDILTMFTFLPTRLCSAEAP